MRRSQPLPASASRSDCPESSSALAGKQMTWAQIRGCERRARNCKEAVALQEERPRGRRRREAAAEPKPERGPAALGDNGRDETRTGAGVTAKPEQARRAAPPRARSGSGHTSPTNVEQARGQHASRINHAQSRRAKGGRHIRIRCPPNGEFEPEQKIPSVIIERLSLRNVRTPHCRP